MTPPQKDKRIMRRLDAPTQPRNLAQEWTAANGARPGWTIHGLARGPRLTDPTIDGKGWVAWAKGPEGDAAIEGSGPSPEQAVHDLAKRLRASR